MAGALTEKLPPAELIIHYPRPCDHCGGRLSFYRDTWTDRVFLECKGCFCEWTPQFVLTYKGSVCPTHRQEAV